MDNITQNTSKNQETEPKSPAITVTVRDHIKKKSTEASGDFVLACVRVTSEVGPSFTRAIVVTNNTPHNEILRALSSLIVVAILQITAHPKMDGQFQPVLNRLIRKVEEENLRLERHPWKAKDVSATPDVLTQVEDMLSGKDGEAQ